VVLAFTISPRIHFLSSLAAMAALDRDSDRDEGNT
jgi:hypothetical protein